MTTTVLYADTTDDTAEYGHAVYATARAGAGAYSVGPTALTAVIGQYGNGTYYIEQGFFSWDTSGIPDTDTVSAAVLDLWITADGSATDFTLEAAAYNWGTTVTSADWQDGTELGALTVLATRSTVGISVGAYNAFTEVSGGLAAAINKTGTTYLVIFSSLNRLGTAPSGGGGQVTVQMGDQGGVQRPRLTITHASADANAPATPAAATGAAYGALPNVGPSPGVIAATGTAYTLGPSIAASAGHASATGAAYGALPGLGAVAGHASATVWVTVGESSNLDTAAGHAAATAAALQAAPPPAVSATVSATAAATGAAGTAYAAIGANSAIASPNATALAFDPTIVIVAGAFAAAEHIAALAAAYSAVASFAINAGHASATGAAYDGTVTVSGVTAAAPAAATGAALAASVATSTHLGHIAVTAAAYDAGVTATGLAPPESRGNSIRPVIVSAY